MNDGQAAIEVGPHAVACPDGRRGCLVARTVTGIMGIVRFPGSTLLGAYPLAALEYYVPETIPATRPDRYPPKAKKSG